MLARQIIDECLLVNDLVNHLNRDLSAANADIVFLLEELLAVDFLSAEKRPVHQAERRRNEPLPCALFECR